MGHLATFWDLATDEPAAPFRAGLAPDPGFARRLLSRLYPTVTVASLGSFPLNRSASAGPGEIYVGSFPGVTVIQTPVSGPLAPSATAGTWLALVDAPTILLFAHDPETATSGFARWESGRLTRSFAGADDRIVEDEGMPLPFERPYWAGEFPLEEAADTPLALPFAPSSLLRAAHRDWLGFDLEPGGPDVPVYGFATDGRREIRRHDPRTGPAAHLTRSRGRADVHAEALREGGGLGEGAGGGEADADHHRFSPYVEDDYERLSPGTRSPGGGRLADLAGAVGDAVRRGAAAASRRWGGRRR